ncbi:hypothetical protein [Kineococcus sp. SYSU DK001]|uniref:hypothetical protein n=1 Tax=Kineococcus sp. SYSU DK001 TaxID=3383122 RepID=UPI003D7EC1E0
MAVWRSFMDLVHLIGALGCLALTGGFAAQGHGPRAAFYGLCTMAFAVALARRLHAHHQPAPTVVDLRGPATREVTREATGPR